MGVECIRKNQSRQCYVSEDVNKCTYLGLKYLQINFKVFICQPSATAYFWFHIKVPRDKIALRKSTLPWDHKCNSAKRVQPQALWWFMYRRLTKWCLFKVEHGSPWSLAEESDRQLASPDNIYATIVKVLSTAQQHFALVPNVWRKHLSSASCTDTMPRTWNLGTNPRFPPHQ